MKCKDCVFHESLSETSKDSYCVMKDLYTITDNDHECDEEDIKGEPYFHQK